MPRHSVFASTLALLIGGLFGSICAGQNPDFQARMAAWQQPRGVPAAPAASPAYATDVAATGEVYYADEPGLLADGCGQCGCDGSCGGNCAGDCIGPRGFGGIGRDPACYACMSCRPPMWWLRSDALLWWRKGRDLPVLVTSSDDPNVLVGEIVLYGGEVEGGSPQGGARIDFGTWLGPDECLGIGGRFWGIGNERLRFTASSDTVIGQTIERPFLLDDGTPESLVISDATLGVTGDIDVESTSEAFGADAYARLSWCRFCDVRVDLIAGYQFSRINEELKILSQSIHPVEGTLDVGDQWLTRNEFHGGTIGLLYESCRGCWTTTCLVRVGIGSMRQTVHASGFQNDLDAGLYVEEPTTLTRDKFVAVPELDVAWSYAINDCWSMNVGYSLIYWSNVARPESMIDIVDADGVSVNFRDESFWVQGLTLGASCRF